MRRLMSISAVMAVVLGMQAVSAATISLSPSQGELIAGCPAQIEVLLDTRGQQTTAMDLVLVANQQELDFNGFDVQGGMFRSYTAPRINAGDVDGTHELYVLATTSTRHGTLGEGRIGVVTITPKEGTTTATLEVKMVPNVDTNDSNVAVMVDGSAVDVLDTVLNAEFTVVEGNCGVATVLEALTVENTQKGDVEIIENKHYVSPFASEERKDAMMQWFVVNSTLIAVTAGIVLILIIGCVVYMIRRKKITPVA